MKNEDFVALAQPCLGNALSPSTEVVKGISQMARNDQGNATSPKNGKLADTADNFVHKQNLLRSSIWLATEKYPATRNHLSELPVARDKNFSTTAERLDKMDGHIAKCQSFISLQRDLIVKLKRDGQDIRQAERILLRTTEIHDLCVSYRHVLFAVLDRQAAYARQNQASRQFSLRRRRTTVKPMPVLSTAANTAVLLAGLKRRYPSGEKPALKTKFPEFRK